MDYTEDEVLEILKDDSRVDEFLSSLTGDDLKKYLIYVNSKVRNVPYTENEICPQTMVAGSLVSPSNEIQNRYFDKMANALSNIQGRKNKATMIKDFSYADGQMFSFPVDKNNDDKDRILGKWQKEDFFKVISVANLLKEDMLDMIIDFFEHPESFIVEGQLNMREALTTKSGILDEQDYTVLETLQKTSSLDINGTQTAKNIEQLVALLQQMSIQNNSVINCENLGRQVVTEMSDFILEDETEQGISNNEKDSQKTIENNTNEQQL